MSTRFIEVDLCGSDEVIRSVYLNPKYIVSVERVYSQAREEYHKDGLCIKMSDGTVYNTEAWDNVALIDYFEGE